MLMKELFHDILINSQNAYGLNADIVSKWLVQKKSYIIMLCLIGIKQEILANTITAILFLWFI